MENDHSVWKLPLRRHPVFGQGTAARLVSPRLLEIGGYHGLYVAEKCLSMISLGLVYLLPLASPPREKVIRLLDVITYCFVSIALGLSWLSDVFTGGRQPPGLDGWLSAPLPPAWQWRSSS